MEDLYGLHTPPLTGAHQHVRLGVIVRVTAEVNTSLHAGRDDREQHGGGEGPGPGGKHSNESYPCPD